MGQLRNYQATVAHNRAIVQLYDHEGGRPTEPQRRERQNDACGAPGRPGASQRCRGVLLDLDPQRSAADWWRARKAETPQLVEADPGSLRSVLDAARADGVKLAVIDTRPSDEHDAALVAALSDLILIPTRPAILDLRAIMRTL